MLTSLFLVSSESDFPNEAEIINRIFSCGLERFHLRRPLARAEDIVKLLLEIDRRFYKNIVVHSHYNLALEYGLGGIHLPERTPILEKQALLELRRADLSVSSSVHSLSMARVEPLRFDYLFLGPVFASISKPAYGPGEFSCIKQNLDRDKLVAIGGISIQTLPQALSLGFRSVAVLGAVWQSSQPVEAFRELLVACNSFSSNNLLEKYDEASYHC